MQVRPLALLSELGIWRCRELQCRSQTWLRYQVAVAVVQASSYNSDSTLSVGTSICLGWGPKHTHTHTHRNGQTIRFYCIAQGTISNYVGHTMMENNI